jgi:tetratricopeptide (TPR) repeat protein
MSTEVTYDDRLRVVPVDRAAYAAAVETMKADLTALVSGPPTASTEVSRLLRQVGRGLLALGEYAEALSYLERALRLAGADPGARTKVLINLGDAYRYAGDLSRAEPRYLEALHIAPAELRDFALQHLGKHRIDQGRLDEAEDLLREALDLRTTKGDPELISCTQQALAHCSVRR